MSCKNVTVLMPDRSVIAILQLHEHGTNHRRLTHFSRSPRDLNSASRYQYLNRTDERSPTPTNSRIDWTSVRFDRRKRAGAKKGFNSLRVEHCCSVG